MHELGVTRMIIAELAAVAKEEGFARITAATILLGTLTTFKKEPILHYFEILKEESGLLRDARLAIAEVAGRVRCNACGETGTIDDAPMALCPACESADVEILNGKELVIKDVSGA